MAETYTIVTTACAFAANKFMLTLWNTDAAKIVKIRRAWILNCQTAAIAGVVTTFEVRLVTAQTLAGVAVVPTSHDSTNVLLPDAQIIIETAGTFTLGALLRRVIWSNDEVAVSGATWDEWETIIPMMCVWDAGYGDANVQPITLRTNEGFSIYHAGASAVSTVDVMFEVTVE